MQNQPKRGAILSCFFPMNEEPDQPGPQARPALVLGSFPDPRNKEIIMVIVAYGTSRKTRVNLGFEIRVDTPEKMAACSLHRATRFTLNRLRILPLTSEYFDASTAGTAIIGTITQADMRVLSGYLDDLAGHADELNFFRPSEAIKSGKRFDPNQVDEFMKKELTGIQMLKRKRKQGRNIYRRYA